MAETTIQENTTYILNGLTFEDLEIICLGLDRIHTPDMCDRAKELTVIIEDIMPPVGRVDSEWYIEGDNINLIDGLNIELRRAKELLEVYESIPTGGFGATLIKQTIDHAELCVYTGNPVEMMKAYQRLQKLE